MNETPNALNRLLTLIEREAYRFARLIKQTIFPPIVTNLLYIFVFGLSLQSQIKEIHGFRFIVFILPGLTAMGVMMNAYANTSTSLFMAKMDQSIQNILASPLSRLQIVVSFVIGGVIRAMVIGILSLTLAKFVVSMPITHPLEMLLMLFLSATLFSCLGILSGLVAESWDHIATFTNFLITPLTYLGGVFYSVENLPKTWKTISQFNPLFYLIDGLRGATLGVSDAPFLISFLIASIGAIGFFTLCVLLFRKGYRLIS